MFHAYSWMIGKSKTIAGGLYRARLWLVIARSYRALSLLAEQSIANTGLCLTDFAALEALLHKGPLTLGLVVRKASQSDRPARVVELTAEGKRLAASCFEQHAKDLEMLMSALSEKEMEQLYRSLKKLRLMAGEKLERPRKTVQEG
jgi:MarR family transcriptional regulator, 2-MHQ and catechol-resistance regulon repressor